MKNKCVKGFVLLLLVSAFVTINHFLRNFRSETMMDASIESQGRLHFRVTLWLPLSVRRTRVSTMLLFFISHIRSLRSRVIRVLRIANVYYAKCPSKNKHHSDTTCAKALYWSLRAIIVAVPETTSCKENDSKWCTLGSFLFTSSRPCNVFSIFWKISILWSIWSNIACWYLKLITNYK